QPPALGEQHLVAGVNAAARLVEARLDAVVREADRALLDHRGGQAAGLGEARPPQPEVDATALHAHSAVLPAAALRGRRRGLRAVLGVAEGAGRASWVSWARAAKGESLGGGVGVPGRRSEEHTSELQSRENL